MKTFALFFIFFLCILSVFGQANPNHIRVNGYVKNDGTYVQPYFRTAPNSTNRDNFSTKGNKNPYTGEPGWIKPESKFNNLYYTTYSYSPAETHTEYASNSSLPINYKNRTYIEDENGGYTSYLIEKDEKTFGIYDLNDKIISYLVMNQKGDWRIFDKDWVHVKTIYLNTEDNPQQKQSSAKSQTSVSKLVELDTRNGFRDLKLGCNLSEIKNYQFKLVEIKDGEEKYEITDLSIKINEVPVKIINCYFILDKLVKIEIVIVDQSSYLPNVIDLLIETFGKPTYFNDPLNDDNLKNNFFFYIDCKDYSWLGKKVELNYSIRKLKSFGNQTTPSSHTLSYTIKDYQKVKEEAKKQILNTKKSDL